MVIKVGSKYRVIIEDCCVQGIFTSTLDDIRIEVEPEDDGIAEAEFKGVSQTKLDYGDTFYFSNGVILTNKGGVKFQEVII